ncbi:MAG: YhbY family RNA-binding protein [Cystobacterineae bacterium]|nr:YhbY family RNA-binding protein [Cystobacterineae bacterium]
MRAAFVEVDNEVNKQRALSGKERRQLSAWGHHLEAIVYVGRAGITEGVCEALSQALADHELVKAKMQDIPGERKGCALELADKTHSALVQLLGKTALYFKAKPQNSRFALPGTLKNQEKPEKNSRAKPAKAASKAPRAFAKKPTPQSA